MLHLLGASFSLTARKSANKSDLLKPIFDTKWTYNVNLTSSVEVSNYVQFLRELKRCFQSKYHNFMNLLTAFQQQSISAAEKCQKKNNTTKQNSLPDNAATLRVFHAYEAHVCFCFPQMYE